MDAALGPSQQGLSMCPPPCHARRALRMLSPPWVSESSSLLSYETEVQKMTRHMPLVPLAPRYHMPLVAHLVQYFHIRQTYHPRPTPSSSSISYCTSSCS